MSRRPKPPEPHTTAGDRGLACRRCGCRHHWVVYSRRRGDGSIARRRECRHCGHQFTTRETEIGAPPVERSGDEAEIPEE